MTETLAKSHKIASAVYLITGFFNDLEPLKWKLRSLSADLVSNQEKDKVNILRDLGALFSVAKSANLISEANYEILSREVTRFQETLENPLDKELFREVAPVERTLPPTSIPQEVKDKTIQETQRGELLTDLNSKTFKEFGAWSRPTVKKNSRQSVIIGLLKRKKEIMIKDVSPLISGCSEKTIQRELSAMVTAGILRKIGEKRWSRYRLS